MAAEGKAEAEALNEKSRAIAVGFQDKLRGQLMTALQAGGPTAAIEACKEVAPAAAGEASAESGTTVRRTSFKVRNPNSSADSWERQTMDGFAARKAAGEPLGKIETGAWIDAPDGRVYRYMKAIPTGEMCTQCHGSTIAPAVAVKLADLYPQDRATGFAVGDMRGAVSISWPATAR
jgi:hypothetical protein